jgi:hypothetical protein
MKMVFKNGLIYIDLKKIDNMKKSRIIGLIILSVFVLCSLSYQPIIADENIKFIESRVSIKDKLFKFKKFKTEIGDDCGCGIKADRRFPILCQILLPIGLFYYYLVAIYYDYYPPQIIGMQYHFLIEYAESINCWWVELIP